MGEHSCLHVRAQGHGERHGGVLQSYRREGRPRVEGVRQVDEEGWTLPRGGLLSATDPLAALGADGASIQVAGSLTCKGLADATCGRHAWPSQLLGRRVEKVHLVWRQDARICSPRDLFSSVEDFLALVCCFALANAPGHVLEFR